MCQDDYPMMSAKRNVERTRLIYPGSFLVLGFGYRMHRVFGFALCPSEFGILLPAYHGIGRYQTLGTAWIGYMTASIDYFPCDRDWTWCSCW